MSEDQPAYLTVEQALNTLEQRDTITNDPTASHWLKRAITELWERDTVDALNDLTVLRELLEKKHCIDQLLMQKLAEMHDGTRH